jgi:hypothetical protein
VLFIVVPQARELPHKPRQYCCFSFFSDILRSLDLSSLLSSQLSRFSFFPRRLEINSDLSLLLGNRAILSGRGFQLHLIYLSSISEAIFCSSASDSGLEAAEQLGI